MPSRPGALARILPQTRRTMAKKTAPTKALAPTAQAMAPDAFGRVHMAPGTASGDRFAFDNGGVRVFEQKGWSALSIAAHAAEARVPPATAIMDLVEAGLKDADGRPVPVREAVARYDLVPLWTHALVALVWALQDLGLLPKNAPDATPDTSGEA